MFGFVALKPGHKAKKVPPKCFGSGGTTKDAFIWVNSSVDVE
jgi:hypothetical protein